MFLPVESLYAEVLSIDGLCEQMQTNYKVMIAGPSNITAFLNSLRLGFRTLKIQKESREVYKILAQFKTQFVSFVGELEKAQDHIGRANKTLEDAKKRTATIKEKLDKTDDLTMPEETPVLPPVD